MFESILISTLQADTELAGYVSTFEALPAIFSEFAPDAAELPYIVCMIKMTGVDDTIIQKFSVVIDYYNYGVSWADPRKAVQRIEHLLDGAELDHERYSNIRLFADSGAPINEADPRAVPYSISFSARAGRKAFVESII
jgi:hypothetical protein